jgi:hypothetical protein
MGGTCSTRGELRNVYSSLVGKPEGKRPLGRPRRGWESNIKMDLREGGWGGMDWIVTCRPSYVNRRQHNSHC